MTTPGGKRSGRELIAYYLYHTRTNHASFYHVPLLQLGDNRAVFFLRVLHAHDRLMEVRVEGLTLRLDIFEAFFFQRLDKLLVHHLDARAEPAFIGAVAAAKEGVISGPVAGIMGTYVFQVNGRETGAFYTEDDAKAAQARMDSYHAQMLLPLMMDKTVDDNRARFY